jgi:hypothetical protein
MFTPMKDPWAARAGRVDRLREHFLSRPRFSEQQHGRVRLRGAPSLALGVHRGG